MYEHLTQRPETFEWNPDDVPLKRGLVFAGLGRTRNTTRYTDSSPYGNHGVLTAMEVDTDWVFDPTLGRWCTSPGGTNEYILLPLIASVVPVTLAAWARITSDGTSRDIISLANSGSVHALRLNAGMATAGDPVRAVAYAATGGIATAGTIALSTWAHCAAVFATNASRTAYYNGVPGSENTTAITPSGIDRAAIGCNAVSGFDAYFIGQLADALIWNRILSLSEIQQLADPSNVMLSGLILPPRRRLWGVSGEVPATQYVPNKIHHYQMAGGL